MNKKELVAGIICGVIFMACCWIAYGLGYWWEGVK